MVQLSYNPFAPDFYEDPDKLRSVYHNLRDEAPLFWSRDANMWVLSRYDDVRMALKNWKIFSNEAGAGSTGPIGAFFKQYPSLLMFDPPRHTSMRKLLSSLITPDRMKGLAGPIREIVNDLLTPLEGKPRFDITHDFAEPLPAIVIADLLGIPRTDAPILMQSVDKLSDFGQANIEQATKEAIETLRDYYVDFFEQRRKKPAGEDIIYKLIAGVRDSILEENEAIGFAILVTIAGGETTTKMLGNSVALLAANPGQRAELVQSPELIPNAVEEALRYNSSTHMLTRAVTEDYALHGKVMREGDTVAILYNSANNDGRKFADPDRFDIHRKDLREHVAFGGGIHACIGAPLARLELIISIEELLKRWPRFTLELEHSVRFQNPFAQGWRNLVFIPN